MSKLVNAPRTVSPSPRLAAPEWALVRVNDAAQWSELTRAFLDHNYRQGWTYGLASAERYHADIERVAIKVGSEIVGLAAVRLKNIPLMHTGIAHVGGGPLTRRGRTDDLDSLRTCLLALRHEYLNRRSYTLRILPPLNPAGEGEQIAECFRACGFGDSSWPPPYRTIVVNIKRPLPEIRKTLAQKWRNCLNKAERQNLTIRTGSSLDFFDEFLKLYNSFLDRKHISVELPAEFYRTIRAQAHNDEGYLISLAIDSDGVPVAGHLASMFGDSGVSIMAATTEPGLKVNSANLLQWNVLVEAHQRGLQWYDLGGIDPEAHPGVYHFKSGLGGGETAGVGPFQAAPSGLLGILIPASEKFYRWALRHTRKNHHADDAAARDDEKSPPPPGGNAARPDARRPRPLAHHR